MSIFDIQKDRLVELSLEDLRKLISLLCEAERERRGGHRTDVRSGGKETARDGGIDVMVDSTELVSEAGPLARRHVGIQVKRDNLSRSKITGEMRKDGTLRPAISKLAAQGGSYFIASARADCSETMLQSRIDSMRSAVADDPNAVGLHLDFMDCNAIVRWVSAHPSVAVWLRGRLTLPILAGWHPFGRWSSTPHEECDKLICKEGLVFQFQNRERIQNIPEALDKIRRLVSDGTGAVRIAGLSGIGKTRIVQALFETEGSVSALQKSQALYTDLDDSSNPTPTAMLEVLIRRDEPAILIVDNCPPETHRTLVRKLAKHPRVVRLITVEYDVRTDQPEKTDAILIKTNGFEIVESLLIRQRNGLLPTDARRISQLAYGNARLGFALAQAVRQSGSPLTLGDAAFFNRLFWQRDGVDQELAWAAQVLSLVYSFDVDGEKQIDELSFLGSIARLPRETMYRHANTLCDKGLAQKRANWRAVLPQALANRLAQLAVGAIDFQTIADNFADKPRLRRSLALRLSYLHNCDKARGIVTRWMKVDGPLHDPSADIQTIAAVCHLIPAYSFDFIDGIIAEIRRTARVSPHMDSVTRMIVRIAHFDDTFSRACECLVSLAIATEEQFDSNADDMLRGLFSLYPSGTMASTETRVKVAQRYLDSDNPRRNLRGVIMLKSALRTGRRPSINPSFNDACLDAFIPEPSGRESIDWFFQWLELALTAALHGAPDVRSGVREALCHGMDEVWQDVSTLRTKIDQIARQLHRAEPWVEGWHTLRRLLYHIKKDGVTFPAKDVKSVSQLIVYMEPTDLATRVRAETVPGWDRELGEDPAAAKARRINRLEALGQELATSPEVFSTVGKNLFECQDRSHYSIGVGFGQGSKNPEGLWEILRDLYLSDPDKPKQTCILSGFLHQLDKDNRPIADAIRANCRSVPSLRRIYSEFLPQGVLSANEFESVVEIAGENETEARWLKSIVWHRDRALKDDQRFCLLRAFLKREDGAFLVVDALNKLGFVEMDSRDVWPERLNVVGVDAVTAIISIKRITAIVDIEMVKTLSYCLRDDNVALADRCMDAVVARAEQRSGNTNDVRRTLATLARKYPDVFLCKVFSDGVDESSIRFKSDLDREPLTHVPIKSLIAWCDENPTRWSKVVPNISPFAKGFENDGDADEISLLAEEVLKAAPSPGEVVVAFLNHLESMSRFGGGSDILERRLTCIENLRKDYTPEVDHTIALLVTEIRKRIADIRQVEQEEVRQRENHDLSYGAR